MRLGLLALATAVLICGCASRPMLGPERPVRVVVLDAATPEDHGYGGVEVAGWWFGARDLLRDSNDGLHWGNHLSAALEKHIPNLTLHFRSDLRSYMSAKETLLKSAYPELSDRERRRVLLEQSPLDYGQSLGADYVVTGRIYEAKLIHNRTFHWWKSQATIEMQVWDVAQRQVVWSWMEEDTAWFRSVYGLLERLADRCAKKAGASGAFYSFSLPASGSLPAPE